MTACAAKTPPRVSDDDIAAGAALQAIKRILVSVDAPARPRACARTERVEIDLGDDLRTVTLRLNASVNILNGRLSICDRYARAVAASNDQLKIDILAVVEEALDG